MRHKIWATIPVLAILAFATSAWAQPYMYELEFEDSRAERAAGRLERLHAQREKALQRKFVGGEDLPVTSESLELSQTLRLRWATVRMLQRKVLLDDQDLLPEPIEVNDPEILRAQISLCESIESALDDRVKTGAQVVETTPPRPHGSSKADARMAELASLVKQKEEGNLQKNRPVAREAQRQERRVYSSTDEVPAWRIRLLRREARRRANAIPALPPFNVRTAIRSRR